MAIYEDLQEKNILITGASRGIGKTIAEEVARQKAHIFYTSRRTEEDEAGFTKNLLELGASSVTALYSDLVDFPKLKIEIDDKVKPKGCLHGLVNNAGMTDDRLLMRVKPEHIQKTLETNLSSAIYLTALVSPLLMKAKGASVVNMSSVVGIIGNPGQSLYAASKAGLIGFTKSLAKELGSRKVRANAICPGFIKSDMTDSLPEKVKENYLSGIPLQNFGEAEDVANLTLFLLSESSKYITGESLKVDGGMI